MKNNILTYIIYLLAVIGMIITLLIVYKDIDSSFSFAFIIGYITFVFLAIIYSMIAIMINLRRLRWIGIRKRLYKFITYFVLLSVCSYITGYIFKYSELDLLNIIPIPLGLSLGIAFLDLVFFKDKKL